MNTLRFRTLLSCSAALVAGVGIAGSYALAAAPHTVMSPGEAGATGEKDRLIFKDGRIIEGELLEETDTEVKFLVVVGSISAPQTYSKSEILGIERGTGEEPVVAPTADEPRGVAAAQGSGA